LANKTITVGIKDTKIENPKEYSLDEVSSTLDPIVIRTHIRSTSKVKQTVLTPKVNFEGITRVFEVSVLKNISEEKAKKLSLQKELSSPLLQIEENKVALSFNLNLPGKEKIHI
jgi:hypothetical protein